MLALTEITSWHYGGFIAVVLVFLAIDLGLFHRQPHVVRFREALFWSFIWFATALIFGALLLPYRGAEETLEFLTGYVIELSLSMDNIFAIALIFAFFRVPAIYQHRVLFWGIIGALVMRGAMIALGAALIQTFHWLLYVLGLFLIYTGIKMIAAENDSPDPEKNLFIRLARRFFPISPEFDGQKFVTRFNGRLTLTPLTLVLVMVETTDLIFAVDSIPAIFAVTEKPFLIFSSNVFAILGLRSLYFVLANALGYFRYLKVGLSIVLVFIGAKMFFGLNLHAESQPWYRIHISTAISLGAVIGIIAASIIASIVSARWSRPKKP